MATFTVRVCGVEELPGGRAQVDFCDPAKPNEHYRCTSRSGADADVTTAINALIAQRKAAGISYPGKPPVADRTITATV